MLTVYTSVVYIQHWLAPRICGLILSGSSFGTACATPSRERPVLCAGPADVDQLSIPVGETGRAVARCRAGNDTPPGGPGAGRSAHALGTARD